jgi:hypothetical protein
MLLHLLPAVGLGEILNGGKEVFAVLDPILDGKPLVIRQRIDLRLHGGVGRWEGHRWASAGVARYGRAPGGPIVDHVENHQNRQQQEPLVTVERLQHMTKSYPFRLAIQPVFASVPSQKSVVLTRG